MPKILEYFSWTLDHFRLFKSGDANLTVQYLTLFGPADMLALFSSCIFNVCSMYFPCISPVFPLYFPCICYAFPCITPLDSHRISQHASTDRAGAIHTHGFRPAISNLNFYCHERDDENQCQCQTGETRLVSRLKSQYCEKCQFFFCFYRGDPDVTVSVWREIGFGPPLGVWTWLDMSGHVWTCLNSGSRFMGSAIRPHIPTYSCMFEVINNNSREPQEILFF